MKEAEAKGRVCPFALGKYQIGRDPAYDDTVVRFPSPVSTVGLTLDPEPVSGA
jgi:hypothetical protein